MGLKSFIKGVLNNKSKKVDIAEALMYEEMGTDIALQAYAIQTVAGLIATLLSKCEIKTFQNGKPVKGEEWYLLNIRPNANQSAAEFWSEVCKKLLVQGESLIIEQSDNLICADYFSVDKYAIGSWKFRNISRESQTFNRSWDMSDCMYLNLDNGKPKALICDLIEQYNSLMQITYDNYSNISGQKGMLEVSAVAQGNAKFEEQFKQLMSVYFKDFFKNKNAVIPLYNGMKYTPISYGNRGNSTSETTDYDNMITAAVEKTALIYNVAPALFKGDANGLDEAITQTMTTAIDPIANRISQEITAKRYTMQEVIKGNYAKMCTDNIKHIDIFALATNVDKLISSSFMSVDETREKAGIEPTGEAWSKQHIRTKNYEPVSGVGGENNG